MHVRCDEYCDILRSSDSAIVTAIWPTTYCLCFGQWCTTKRLDIVLRTAASLISIAVAPAVWRAMSRTYEAWPVSRDSCLDH